MQVHAGHGVAHDLLRVGQDERDRQQCGDPQPGEDELRAAAEVGAEAEAGEHGPHRIEPRRDGVGQRDAVEAGHALQHADGGIETARTEEHPADDDGDEGDEPRQRLGERNGEQPLREEARGGVPPGVVDAQIHAVQRAPGDEGPARAVPQAAEQHGEHEVAVAHEPPGTVAAERDVEVVAQEGRQRHVPAPPEFDDVGGFVGRVEVDRQDDAEHARGADGHVGIAGEVEVELQRVGERAAPGLEKAERIARGGSVEDGCGVLGDAVGKDGFLEQAEGEDAEADGHVLRARGERAGLHELRQHVAVMDDGAGDELREEGDEERVVGEAVFARLALVRVDQIGDLLEGEEGDGQRQDDGVEVEVGSGEGVEAADGEVGVFEVAEQGEVEEDAED